MNRTYLQNPLARKKPKLTDHKEQRLQKAREIRALFKAIKSGDIAQVKRYLENGDVDLSKRNKDGFTFLHVAIKQKQNDIAKLLIRNGAPLNQPSMSLIDYEVWTPLNLAIQSKNMDIAYQLIVNGADTNVFSMEERGHTPLSLALETGQFELAEVLINYGADVDGMTIEGDFLEPDLTRAVRKSNNDGNIEAVSFLLEHGCDPNVIGGVESSLSEACSEGNYQLVCKLLEHGANPNKDIRYLESRLSSRYKSADTPKIMKALLEYGLNPNKFSYMYSNRFVKIKRLLSF